MSQCDHGNVLCPFGQSELEVSKGTWLLLLLHLLEDIPQYCVKRGFGILSQSEHSFASSDISPQGSELLPLAGWVRLCNFIGKRGCGLFSMGLCLATNKHKAVFPVMASGISH